MLLHCTQIKAAISGEFAEEEKIVLATTGSSLRTASRIQDATERAKKKNRPGEEPRRRNYAVQAEELRSRGHTKRRGL